jgi:hypothetical protein
MKSELVNLDQKVTEMKSALEFAHFPFLQSFRKNFLKILYEMYEEKYVDEVLFSKTNSYLMDIFQ